MDATAVEEKKLQANPRGKKKGEKFRFAAGTSVLRSLCSIHRYCPRGLVEVWPAMSPPGASHWYELQRRVHHAGTGILWWLHGDTQLDKCVSH